LFIEHQCTSGFEQKQIFVKMIHAFMQELCGFLPTSYIITLAAYGNAKVAGYPHVVPASYSFNRTLFYFTSSEDPDNLHDLWVKHAQVYLVDPTKGDVAVESATNVVFTNFFIIDGAVKDKKTGAWNLWSASDIEASQIARVDLRNLENNTELALMTSHVIHKRLQAIQQRPGEPKNK
jgi:hypothetical protein